MSGGVDLRRYTLVAIGFHWLIAAVLLVLIVFGLVMTKLGLPPARQFQLYQLHKSIGITVLLLSVLRLAWRLSHRPPPLTDMPCLERRLAEGAHGLLYVLIIGLPLSGWAMVSASRYNIPTVLFGVIRWPHLPILPALQNKAPAEAALKLIHAYGAYVLIALVLLHAGAALRHHFVLKDGTLRRMVPRLRRPASKNPGIS
jgi:cytochrome b561